MKAATRTRVDTVLSYGDECRVTGRKDHVISTDVKIRKAFEGQVFKYPELDPRFDRHFPTTTNTVAHLEARYDEDETKQADVNTNDVVVQLEDFPINKSIQKCDFYPLSSVNEFDTKPSDQLLLLPYVTEEIARKNMTFRDPLLVAATRAAGSEIPVVGWSDRSGDDADTPAQERSYVYFADEQGVFFLHREDKEYRVVDEEKEIYDNTVPKRSRFTLDGNNARINSGVRFQRKILLQPLEIDPNQVIPAQQQLDGLGIPLERKRKLIDGKYQNVYRTNLERYAFAVKASYFTHLHAGIVGLPTLEYSFLPSFDIEIGPFDESGEAVTRAVNFDGEDITEEVTAFGFLEMSLWVPGEPTFIDATWNVHPVTNTGAVIQDAQQPPQNLPAVAAAHSLDFMVDNYAHPIRGLSLFLPIRRYAITARDAIPTSLLNDAQIRSPVYMHMLDHFKVNTDQYSEDAPGPGCDIKSQFDLEVIRSRDENNALAAADFALAPRRPINLRERSMDFTSDSAMGIFSPVFAFNAAIRELQGLRVSETSELGQQLSFIAGATEAQVPAAYVMLLKIERTRRPVAQNFVIGGANIPANKNPATPVNQGWYPNQAAGANVVDAATQMVFENEDNEIYVLFVKGSLAVGGGTVTLGPTAKFIYKDKRYLNPTVVAELGVIANQARSDDYNAGKYRFQHPSELTPFFDCQTVATQNYVRNPLVADIRLNAYLANIGYLHSVVDPFWSHTALAVDPNAALVLAPANNPEYANSRADFDAEYAAIAAALRPQFLYYEVVASINDNDDFVELMNGLPGFPIVFPAGWVLPVVPDPLPPLYNPDETPYVAFPTAATLVLVQGFYDAVQLMNNDPLYEEITDVLTGVGTLQYFSADSLQEEAAVQRVELCRSRLIDLEFQENLFAFGGMSQFRPSSIFPILDQYPPLIQDFRLRIGESRLVKFRHFSPEVSDSVVLELQPKSGYELEWYSQDQFSQENKSIQKVDMLYPDITRWEKTFPVVSGGEYKIPFETHRAAPEFVFFHIERQSGPGEVYDTHQPCINTISLSFFNQDVQTISTLNKIQLFHCTRRNSNFRTDVRQNRQDIGGILLSRNDFGNWARWEQFYSVDNFAGEFIIRENQISAIDDTVIDKLEAGEKALRDAQPRKIRVLFIYEKYGLTGSAHTMRFWYK